MESQSSWKFDKVDGWSKRAPGQGSPKYDVTFGGRSMIIVFSGTPPPPKLQSIDLMRTGQAPQRLWEPDAEPQRANKSDYERIFETR
jgi:hypothetical protein